MPVFIYGLHCPLEQTIRYVGKSVDPRKRLRGHLCGARRFAYDHHTARWLRKLDAAGLEPEIVILHECAKGERWQDVERRFIASADDRGWRLTNSTNGGEGLDYRDPKDRARYMKNWRAAMARLPEDVKRAALEKMREASRTPETNARRAQSVRKAYANPALIEKMREVNSEINARPSVKAAKSAASKAMWSDPDSRRKLLSAFARPETKAKQSARKRASWDDPVVGAKLRSIHSSDETRRKKSEAAKRRATPEYRAMMAERTRASWASGRRK